MARWQHRSSSFLILLGILIPSLLVNLYFLVHFRTQPIDPGVTVLGVLDGDTLVVNEKTRVRLRQVDAPELVFCGGKEAKQELESLVAGKKVRMEEIIPDQYGRGMALVYVGQTLVNEEMLRSGWVRYHSDQTSKTDLLKQIAQTTKETKKGIFGTCQSATNLDHPTCIIKGNIDPNGGKKRYYLPSCAQYAFAVVEQDIGEQWFCTEAEAKKAGYEKANTCPR